MTNEQNVTLGEIYRMCQANNTALAALTAEVRDRHHKLAGDVNGAAVTAAVLKDKAERTDKRLAELETEVDDVTKQSAWISGAGAVFAFVSTLVPWPWKAGQ
jgi:hypothetical protein